MVILLRLIEKRLMMPLFRRLWLRKEVLRLRLIFSILSENFHGIRLSSVRNCLAISIHWLRIIPNVILIYVIGKNSTLVLLTLLVLLALLNRFSMLRLMLPACILITGIAPVLLLSLTGMLKRLSNVLISTFGSMKKEKLGEEGGDFYEKAETD